MDSSDRNRSMLPFTGERFTPECVREIWYEHWHRYAFVLNLAAGKRVLDAACGEGYGSALMAQVATHVTGLDLDAATIEHARLKYAGSPRPPDFKCGSVTDIDAADGAFDMIVSFETIEHLVEQERMLDEFRRVLAPDGLLVISSPDRDAYNERAIGPNPFHVRELDRPEFVALLKARFPAIHLLGQKLAFHSVMWNVGERGGDAESLILDSVSGAIRSGHVQLPIYHVAVCAASMDNLPELPGLSLFADKQASVYHHYNSEIDRLIRADHRIIALEAELAELKGRMGGN